MVDGLAGNHFVNLMLIPVIQNNAMLFLIVFNLFKIHISYFILRFTGILIS